MKLPNLVPSIILVPVIVFSATLAIPSALAAESAAGAPVRVSVAKFTDKTASGTTSGEGCHSYSILAERLGNAFSDLLVERLQANPHLEVLERDAIGVIYDKEVALMNSEEDESIKRGKFQKAKISFIGVVDAFEYCQSGSGVSLDVGRLFGFGSIKPSLKASKAMVSVMIRAVDTTTGRVLATSRSKKEQSKNSFGLSADVENIDFAAAGFKQSALGEVIREAITEAGGEILKKLRI